MWPGELPVALEGFMEMSRGAVANASRLSCSVHMGTHIDTPIHFLEHGATVDELPLDILVGPAWVGHLPHVGAIEPGHLRQLDIPQGTRRLLLKTRNSELWTRSEQTFEPNLQPSLPKRPHGL